MATKPGQRARAMRSGPKQNNGSFIKESHSAFIMALEAHAPKANPAAFWLKYPTAQSLPRKVIEDFAARLRVSPSDPQLLVTVNRVIKDLRERPRHRF